MNYKSLYLPLTFLFLYGCGLSEVPVDQLAYKNGLKVLKESSEPFTGKSIRFEGGEVPSEIIEYREGKLDGNIQLFYANGEIKEDFNARVNNEFYIIAKGFDSGNQIRASKRLDKGALKSLVRYGEEHKWYDNGEMQSEGTYSADGSRKVGSWQHWYKNGELKEQGEYSSDLTLPIDDVSRANSKVSGIKIGEWNRWYESGVKSQEIIYRNKQKESILLYCSDETLGFELKNKESLITMKVWACNGTEFVLRDSENNEFKYAEKKEVGTGFLMSNVLDMIESGKYDINADDYYKKSKVERENGQPAGLMTEWDEEGNVIAVKDYNKANFIDPEYLDVFLKKGRFGSYYKINNSSKKWSVDSFNFKKAKPDLEAVQLYLQRKLVDPSKKIAINHSKRDWLGKLKKDQGISQWTYPITVAPEALFDIIKTSPNVKLDSTDSEGSNRLHFCTMLMLGSKPGRCSMEHFEVLIKSIPVNAANKHGMTAVNYVTESFHSRRSVRSRNRKGTDELAIKALELLVKAGADINHTNILGQTALMSALSHQEYKIAKAIIDLGADINIKDKNGHNALYFVFFQKPKSSWRKDKINFKLGKKTKAMLTLLAEHSLNLDEQNINGKSVKDIALKSGAISLVQFLESLAEIKPIEKVVKTLPATDVATKESLPPPIVVDTQTSEQSMTKPLGDTQSVAKVIPAPPGNTESIATITTTPAPETNIKDQEDALYQKALSQIKKSRLSKPKGDSALDTLNQLTELTSKNDDRVVELRQKIAHRYLSLARGRINDYRFRDAIRFIKTSQKIQPSKKARQLLVRVEDKIAEERLLQQQQLQQQQKTNASKQSAPVQEKNGLGSFFESIFD